MIRITQAVLVLICVFTFVTSIASNVNHTELLKAADKKASGEYVRTNFLQIMKKPFDQTTKKKALIIGDSHAQDFLNAMIENKFLSDYQTSTRYIPVRCQIVFTNNATEHIAAKDKSFCAKSDTLTKAKEQIEAADLIILVASWKKWSIEYLPETIAKLDLRPAQKLFVVGRKSFGKISIRKYLRMSAEELIGLRNQPEAHHLEINELMRQTLDKSVFVDLHQKVCGASNDCPVFTPDLKLISFDGGHLTKDGAKYVGEILFQSTPFSEL